MLKRVLLPLRIRYLLYRYSKVDKPEYLVALLRYSLQLPITRYTPRLGMDSAIACNYPRIESILSVLEARISDIRKGVYITNKYNGAKNSIRSLDDFLTTAKDTPIKLGKALFQLHALYAAWTTEWSALPVEKARYYRRHNNKIEEDIVQLVLTLRSMPW